MDLGFLKLTCQTEISRKLIGIGQSRTGTPMAQEGASSITERVVTTLANTEVPTKAVVGDVPEMIFLRDITIVAVLTEDQIPASQKVPLKDNQTAEMSSSQTCPVPSAKTPTEEQSSSIKEDPHNMGKEPISIKESHSAAANQTHPVQFPEAPVQAAENTEELHATAKENYVLHEVRQSRDQLGAVEIPFLSETADGHQSEGKEAVELMQPTVQRDETCTQHAVSKKGAKSHVPDDHPVEPPQSLQMKEGDSEAAGSSANQTQPIPSPEAPVEEQTAPETIECQPTAKQNSILKQPTVQTDEKYIQHVNPKEGAKSQVLGGHPVEPLESLQMKGTDRDSKAAESSANQTQPILSSEAPVEEHTTPETTEHHSTTEQNSILTPSKNCHEEASQKDVGLTSDVCSFPLTLSGIHYIPILLRKAEMKLLSSHSLPQTHVICDQNCNIERLLVCHSCSPESHHCSASEHSIPNCVPRELCILSPRSPHRQEQELRSPRKQEQKLRSAQKKEQKLKSFCSQEQSLISSHKCKLSPHRREQHSRCSQRISDYVGSCYHCYCDYKYDCSQSQENSKESGLSPRYFPHKINDYHSPKERSEAFKVPHFYSPESHTVKTKGKKVMHRKEMAKKKRTSSEKGKKIVKIQTTASNSEDMGSPQHPIIEEKTSSSAISWTLKDRSAAVLAKKEEIEEAYLRALLNFAVVAIMLVEKEPSMQTTIESALRANLRRTGDYYEHMLKNYIDSLAEAS